MTDQNARPDSEVVKKHIAKHMAKLQELHDKSVSAQALLERVVDEAKNWNGTVPPDVSDETLAALAINLQSNPIKVVMSMGRANAQAFQAAIQARPRSLKQQMASFSSRVPMADQAVRQPRLCQCRLPVPKV